ncbi:hypothetical protein LDC_0131, partial [sediment metagenome]
MGVRDIFTCAGWNDPSGDVTLNGTSLGTCTIRDILTYTDSAGRGGLVTIRGYSSVSIRAIVTHASGAVYSGPWRGAGDVIITNIAGNISISGAIDLNSPPGYYVYADGYLSLQAGGKITVTNLDLSKMLYASFD